MFSWCSKITHGFDVREQDKCIAILPPRPAGLGPSDHERPRQFVFSAATCWTLGETAGVCLFPDCFGGYEGAGKLAFKHSSLILCVMTFKYVHVVMYI